MCVTSVRLFMLLLIIAINDVSCNSESELTKLKDTELLEEKWIFTCGQNKIYDGKDEETGVECHDEIHNTLPDYGMKDYMTNSSSTFDGETTLKVVAFIILLIIVIAIRICMFYFCDACWSYICSTPRDTENA